MKVPGVTLLITHFNRPASLERLLDALRELDLSFEDVVVSDDASKPEHVARLAALAAERGFRLVTTPVNRGLQHNLNKGDDAVRTPLTLYIQEDFVPTAKFPQALEHGIAIMQVRPEVDLVRFACAWGRKHPNLVPYKHGFSEIRFSLLQPRVNKFFVYSDWPHLRRRTFFKRFGRYREGLSAIKGEKAMVMSFLQAKGVALETDVNDLFTHENLHAEPSTQNYGRFLRLRRLIPEVVFDSAWFAKLTFECLFRRYRA